MTRQELMEAIEETRQFQRKQNARFEQAEAILGPGADLSDVLEWITGQEYLKKKACDPHAAFSENHGTVPESYAARGPVRSAARASARGTAGEVY
jgi:hypothetical protein